jgi:hypothetical protein
VEGRNVALRVIRRAQLRRPSSPAGDPKPLTMSVAGRTGASAVSTRAKPRAAARWLLAPPRASERHDLHLAREPPRNRRRRGTCRAVAELRQDGVRGGDGRALPSCVRPGRRGSTPPATLRYRPGRRDRLDHPGGRRPQFGQKQLDAGVVAEIGGLSYTTWLSGGELAVKMQGRQLDRDAGITAGSGAKRRVGRGLSRSGNRVPRQ